MLNDKEKIRHRPSLVEEEYNRMLDEIAKKKSADEKGDTNVGMRLKAVRKKIFDKVKNNIGKLIIGGIAISTLNMCKKSPQETQDFKKNYTELKAQKNKAIERKCIKGSFGHWEEKHDNYLKEKGFSLSKKPFKQERWPKGKISLYLEILDKDSTVVGWTEVLAKAGRIIDLDLYAFSDKDGNADLCHLAKQADLRVEETSLSMLKGEKIKDALERDSQLSRMKTFHPFLSKECEKSM